MRACRSVSNRCASASSSLLLASARASIDLEELVHHASKQWRTLVGAWTRCASASGGRDLEPPARRLEEEAWAHAVRPASSALYAWLVRGGIAACPTGSCLPAADATWSGNEPLQPRQHFSAVTRWQTRSSSASGKAAFLSAARSSRTLKPTPSSPRSLRHQTTFVLIKIRF